MHVGTALAVIIYFLKDLKRILSSLLNFHRGERSSDEWWAMNLLISTVATVVFVLLLKKLASTFGRSGDWIAANLLIFGILMFIADFFSKQENGLMLRRNFLKAVFIGVAQSLAIFPGVSRSGATMTVARAMRMSRDEAARFSFLLSLPIIMGGFMLRLPDVVGSNSFSLINCAVGMITSFVVGVITIHFFLGVIKKIGLVYFSIYRVALAFVIFWLGGGIV